MPVTVDDNIAWLRALEARLDGAARAVAEDMARYIAKRTEDKLRRTSHAPGSYYKAPRGAPPASASGALASAMYWTRGMGGSRASAHAGNSARHARLLEFGCEEITPTAGYAMHWTDSGGSWYHTSLPVEEHPFLGPTTEEASDDGGLQEAAIDAFLPFDP